MGTTDARVQLAYILGAFPAPSQTFVAREIRTLLRLGLPLRVFALGRQKRARSEEEDRIWAAEVRHVPAGLSWRLACAHFWFLRRRERRRRYWRACVAVVGLRHRPRYLVLQALHVFWRVPAVARELLASGSTRHVHAHFAVSQTEAALVLATLLDCGFSFTAHARDIYATPKALEQKLRAARFVVTCTEYNARHLSRLCPELPQGRLHVIRHGVPNPPGPAATGARSRLPQGPPLLLSAGRLVAKKGFEVLVDACALLREKGVSFECRIAGAGPLYRGLERRIERAGLRAHVRLLGWQGADEMARLYGAADAFALPSRVVNGGDRDGLPNVLVEAVSLGLAVVSTRVSAIPELIQDGVTGLLVEPEDPLSLAGALERLLSDPALRERLGAAGQRLVRERFDLEANTRRLADLFRPLLDPGLAAAGR